MSRLRLAIGASVLLVCLAYANHWNNVFHFDDEHTIVQNPNIRSLSHLPRLLTDATAASIYPTHAVYRPVAYVTLAIDYALVGTLMGWTFDFHGARSEGTGPKAAPSDGVRYFIFVDTLH